MVGDMFYQLRLEPPEGGTVSLQQTHAVIDQLDWP
jgi:hypothetical protein